ncbi:Phosphoenolpyruvate carboxylase [Camellia lanceoleosa]|uniref:Phosphoenolpyruvate carboxylase n=1 Tax=Camellia lanceoleosa TaxID=1840588 RepID=A0ACC0GZF0_9ERIC|nr:Phosphoenolpyruvate carboxylase [Camellia lanceoleosa]
MGISMSRLHSSCSANPCPSLRFQNCLTQLYAKDITPDDKQELDEALLREQIFVLSAVFPEKMPLVLLNIRKVLKRNGYLLFCDYATGDLAQWRMSSFNRECTLSIQWRIM